MRFIEAGRYDTARAVFEKVLASHPDDPKALYSLGKLEQDGTRSQEYFSMLGDKHPAHNLADDALYALCQYRYAKGYYVSAGKMYRSLVTTYPESDLADDAAYWSATCYLVAEHPDSALAEWKAFLTTYPRSEWREWALLGMGDAFFAAKKYEDALTEYRRVADAPNADNLKSAALNRMGECYTALRQPETARIYFKRVTDDYPLSTEGVLLSDTISPAMHRPSQEETHSYTVQVGAFAHKENAIRLLDRLAARGYDANIISRYPENGTELHVVQVGRYTLEESARVVVERLEKEEHLQPRIVTRRDQ